MEKAVFQNLAPRAKGKKLQEYREEIIVHVQELGGDSLARLHVAEELGIGIDTMYRLVPEVKTASYGGYSIAENIEGIAQKIVSAMLARLATLQAENQRLREQMMKIEQAKRDDEFKLRAGMIRFLEVVAK